MSETFPTSALIGDWIFREDLFGPDPARDRAYLQDFLPTTYPGFFNHNSIELIKEYRSLAGPYLDACLKSIPWERYRIVGFTTTFQQTVASLALARRLKEVCPDILIAFGGANCEGIMGQELLHQFEFIDLVFSGESDRTFPALAETLLKSSTKVLPKQDEVVAGQPIQNMDDLPYPDYSDFEEAIEKHGFRSKYRPQYLIEMSRGCWWGQKHQCNFCGLNGETLSFRSKSGTRVVSELLHLVEQYGAEAIWASDNILDVDYFRTVFPTLKQNGLKLNLFFETKSNLRKDQLSVMKEVGIFWFQPGIESLNTHVLGLMNKGCTALQNIQLLKWARQCGMLLTWNILIGFPGETAEDYERMARYCQAIPHLQPPTSVHPFRLDRFSPYFDRAVVYGLTDLKPFASYSYIYPFSNDVLNRIAYFFHFRYKDGHDPLACARPTLDAVADWMKPESFSVLYAIPGDNILVIYDSRLDKREAQHILTGPGREIYLFCDRIHSLQAILKHLAGQGHNEAWTEHQVRVFLADMLEKGLMLEEDENYLSLAVLVEPDTHLGPLIDPRSRLELLQKRNDARMSSGKIDAQ